MADRCKLLTLTLLLSWVCQGRGQSSDTAGAGEIAQKLVKAHSGWAKLSSSGASIEASEVLREGSTVQYHFFVHGLPADELYKLYSWPVSVREPAVSNGRS